MSTENRPPSVYVDDIFEEILALPRDEREAAIDVRCSGHPSLAQEVRGLLDAEERQPPARRVIAIGERFGRYRLDACLGKGASASVWRAWDDHLQAWTALKLLRPEVGMRADALQNVLHEARAASAIISDHVVRIKNAGKFPNGPYYVEMQLCAEHRTRDDREQLVVGRTLADEPPRSVNDAARLVMEAARGAEAAHRVGVLHRDIKPANILVTPVSRRALVADFGLSTPHVYPEPAAGTPSTATITLHLDDVRGGPLVGTPSFMPPEQAWGEPATRTNDVYALGATLYALLARRAPYQPPGNEGPRPALDVVMEVRERPPESLYKAAPVVPARLVRIVDKAMHRDPDQRYATAADMARDLDHFLTVHPTTVDAGRPWLTLELFLRRHSALVGAGLILGAMLVVFAGVVAMLELRRISLSEENAVAEAQLVAAQAEVVEAEAILAQAEDARAAAQLERDDALSDRRVALLDKERARKGQTAAELDADQARQEKKAAEDEKLAAIMDKLAAEELADEQQKAREDLATALAMLNSRAEDLETARRQLEQEKGWLGGQLTEETNRRLDAEVDRDRAIHELNAMAEEVLRLRQELTTLMEAAAAMEVEGSSDAPLAPWMPAEEGAAEVTAPTETPEGAQPP